MHAGEPVPVDALVDELWGNASPSSAKTTVQTYIMQLRRIIAAVIAPFTQCAGKSAAKELETVPGGYLLNTGSDEIDVHQFERLTWEGHRSRELGDFQAASRQFGEALACWRGPALADIQAGAHLKVDIRRLEEAKLNVLDCRIEADLRLGRHHELLGGLSALVEHHPSHEGLVAHLMLALYRSGRRGDALASYRRLHDTLSQEYGLEPSPQLRRLQRSMLVSERGSSEPLDSWHAVASRGHSSPGTRRGPGRTMQIPAEVGSLSWQAHTSPDTATT
jgi:DNA-binding SARP family transcriptional activator